MIKEPQVKWYKAIDLLPSNWPNDALIPKNFYVATQLPPGSMKVEQTTGQTFYVRGIVEITDAQRHELVNGWKQYYDSGQVVGPRPVDNGLTQIMFQFTADPPKDGIKSGYAILVYGGKLGNWTAVSLDLFE